MRMENTVEEIGDIRDHDTGMDMLKKQVFSVLGVFQPIVKASLTRHSIFRQPFDLANCLPLGDALCLLQPFPFKVNVLSFSAKGLAVDGVHDGSIQD